MVDLEAHCFPPATTLDGGGGIWGPGSPFPVTLGPSSCFFKCHCMGLMCSRPKWTCFSVAVSRPMRDMNCQTGQSGSDNIDLILCVKACQRSSVGLTLPSFRSNW